VKEYQILMKLFCFKQFSTSLHVSTIAEMLQLLYILSTKALLHCYCCFVTICYIASGMCYVFQPLLVYIRLLQFTFLELFFARFYHLREIICELPINLAVPSFCFLDLSIDIIRFTVSQFLCGDSTV